MKATTVKMDEQLLQRVDGMASSLSRSRSWLITQALKRFVDYEDWYRAEGEAGLNDVAQGRVASEKDVAQIFKKWGVDAH